MGTMAYKYHKLDKNTATSSLSKLQCNLKVIPPGRFLSANESISPSLIFLVYSSFPATTSDLRSPSWWRTTCRTLR